MFISNINKELDTLDYSLRISHNERSGEPYLTLVNVKQDAMTSIATTFTPTEISYIRELVRTSAFIKQDVLIFFLNDSSWI